MEFPRRRAAARASALMAERGLSQSELARRVGVTQPAISLMLKDPDGSFHLDQEADPAAITGSGSPKIGGRGACRVAMTPDFIATWACTFAPARGGAVTRLRFTQAG